MAKNKEYELAIKIAGEVERSFLNSTKLTKKELRDLARTASISSAGMGQNLKKGMKEVSNVFGGIEKVAVAATKATAIAVTAAGTAVIGGSIAIGAEFESQMSTVKALAQASTEEIKLLTAKAEEMGIKTKYSATESGQAMEYMAQAGWKTEQMLGGIEGIMNLAAASGEDLAMTSDIVTDALTSFGMKAEESAHFADILAMASAASNTNVEMMGETFKYVAPVAGSLGYTAEDTAFAIGLLANSGIKASQAGTTLRSALTNLVNPTEKMQAAMDKYGISATNQDGSMKTLKETADMLRERLKNLSEEEQQAAMSSTLGINANKLASEAMKDLSEKEILYQTQLGRGKELIEKYDAAQLNSALYKQYTKKEIAKMTQEEKKNIVALEQGKVAMLGLTQAEQATTSARIFGKQAMSGMLAIVNAGEEDYEKLYSAIQNCDGAAKDMANIRMDNLKGDIEIAKSTAEGAGITIYNTMKGPLREGIQYATKAIEKFTKQFPNKIPTVIRHVKNLASAFTTFAKPVLNIGKWLVQNPNAIVSTIVGIGTALVAYKIVSGIIALASAFTALTPAGAIILGIAAAIAVVAGAISYFSEKEKEMANSNLAKHFGDISLSMEELQSVAKHIIQTDNLGKIRNAISEMSELEEISSSIKNAMKILNKMNWKVNIGMELTKEEQQSYQSEIESYIADVQGLVEQKQYAVTLAIGILTGEDDLKDSNVVTKINQFYEGKKTELAKIGTDLNHAVSDAFRDGLLDMDEVKEITELQSQMAKIQSELAGSNFNAELELINVKYGGGDLDAESFKNLIMEINKKTQEAASDYDQALVLGISEIGIVLENGDISTTEYNDTVEQLKKTHLEQIGEIELKANNFIMDTIITQYKDELETAMPEFKIAVDDALQGSVNYINSGMDNMSLNWEVLFGDIKNFEGLSKPAKDGIAQLLELAQPTTDQLNKTKTKFQNLGMEIPVSIQEGINNKATLGALIGDYNSIWTEIANAATGNEEYTKAIEQVEKNGWYVPETLAKGIEKNKNVVKNEVEEMHKFLYEQLKNKFASGFILDIPIKTTLKQDGNTNITVPNSNLNKQIRNGTYLPGHADGGIFNTPHVAWFAEAGTEAVIPINDSENALDLWKLTGQMLGVTEPEEGQKTSKPKSFSQIYDKSKTDKTMQSGTESGQEIKITYSPALNFYGGSPNQETLTGALKISENDFEKMMEKYKKKNGRISFA